jgi:hypothetical protein
MNADDDLLAAAIRLDALYAAAAEHDEKTFAEWLRRTAKQRHAACEEHIGCIACGDECIEAGTECSCPCEPEEDKMAILRKAALSNGQP